MSAFKRAFFETRCLGSALSLWHSPSSDAIAAFVLTRWTATGWAGECTPLMHIDWETESIVLGNCYPRLFEWFWLCLRDDDCRMRRTEFNSTTHDLRAHWNWYWHLLVIKSREKWLFHIIEWLFNVISYYFIIIAVFAATSTSFFRENASLFRSCRSSCASLSLSLSRLLLPIEIIASWLFDFRNAHSLRGPEKNGKK